MPFGKYGLDKPGSAAAEMKFPSDCQIRRNKHAIPVFSKASPDKPG